ncbi:MAG TPA: hypothetical protein VKR29_06860 [Candidatus Binataceae bacterium]|nr:hypothetical protein [Candidatus Binataceae bacterium]
MRTLLALTLTISLLPAAAAAAPNSDNISASQVTEGFRISPIPEASLTFKRGQRGLVGLGSYIVNGQADCSGCHSYPQFLAAAPGSPFTGPSQSTTTVLSANYNTTHYLAGGQCFGPFMARNITPTSGTNLPDGLSETNFITMMRTGEDIECESNMSDPICAIEPGAPHAPLQVMPWPAFHNMTDRDLKAVYAYLSALPSAVPCNTPADGCPGFSGTAMTSSTYTYTNSADCPNPAPAQ